MIEYYYQHHFLDKMCCYYNNTREYPIYTWAIGRKIDTVSVCYGVAKCSVGDRFEKKLGRDLALQRLLASPNENVSEYSGVVKWVDLCDYIITPFIPKSEAELSFSKDVSCLLSTKTKIIVEAIDQYITENL